MENNPAAFAKMAANEQDSPPSQGLPTSAKMEEDTKTPLSNSANGPVTSKGKQPLQQAAFGGTFDNTAACGTAPFNFTPNYTPGVKTSATSQPNPPKGPVTSKGKQPLQQAKLGGAFDFTVACGTTPFNFTSNSTPGAKASASSLPTKPPQFSLGFLESIIPLAPAQGGDQDADMVGGDTKAELHSEENRSENNTTTEPHSEENRSENNTTTEPHSEENRSEDNADDRSMDYLFGEEDSISDDGKALINCLQGNSSQLMSEKILMKLVVEEESFTVSASGAQQLINELVEKLAEEKKESSSLSDTLIDADMDLQFEKELTKDLENKLELLKSGLATAKTEKEKVEAGLVDLQEKLVKEERRRGEAESKAHEAVEKFNSERQVLKGELTDLRTKLQEEQKAKRAAEDRLGATNEQLPYLEQKLNERVEEIRGTFLEQFNQELATRDQNLRSTYDIMHNEALRKHQEELTEKYEAIHKEALLQQKSAHDQVLAEQQAAHEQALAAQQAAHDRVLAEQQTVHDRVCAEQQAVHDRVRAEQQAAPDQVRAEQRAANAAKPRLFTKLMPQHADTLLSKVPVSSGKLALGSLLSKTTVHHHESKSSATMTELGELKVLRLQKQASAQAVAKLRTELADARAHIQSPASKYTAKQHKIYTDQLKKIKDALAKTGHGWTMSDYIENSATRILALEKFNRQDAAIRGKENEDLARKLSQCQTQADEAKMAVEKLQAVNKSQAKELRTCRAKLLAVKKVAGRGQRPVTAISRATIIRSGIVHRSLRNEAVDHVKEIAEWKAAYKSLERRNAMLEACQHLQHSKIVSKLSTSAGEDPNLSRTELEVFRDWRATRNGKLAAMKKQIDAENAVKEEAAFPSWGPAQRAQALKDDLARKMAKISRAYPRTNNKHRGGKGAAKRRADAHQADLDARPKIWVVPDFVTYYRETYYSKLAGTWADGDKSYNLYSLADFGTREPKYVLQPAPHGWKGPVVDSNGKYPPRPAATSTTTAGSAPAAAPAPAAAVPAPAVASAASAPAPAPAPAAVPAPAVAPAAPAPVPAPAPAAVAAPVLVAAPAPITWWRGLLNTLIGR